MKKYFEVSTSFKDPGKTISDVLNGLEKGFEVINIIFQGSHTVAYCVREEVDLEAMFAAEREAHAFAIMNKKYQTNQQVNNLISEVVQTSKNSKKK